jgi:hypothetical protein
MNHVRGWVRSRGPLGAAAKDEDEESRLGGIAGADDASSRPSGKRSSSSLAFSSSTSTSVYCGHFYI